MILKNQHQMIQLNEKNIALTYPQVIAVICKNYY